MSSNFSQGAKSNWSRSLGPGDETFLKIRNQNTYRQIKYTGPESLVRSKDGNGLNLRSNEGGMSTLVNTAI
jgi:hypothetical protein